MQNMVQSTLFIVLCLWVTPLGVLDIWIVQTLALLSRSKEIVHFPTSTLIFC